MKYAYTSNRINYHVKVVEFAFDSAGSDEEVPIKKGSSLHQENSVRSSELERARSQQGKN